MPPTTTRRRRTTKAAPKEEPQQEEPKRPQQTGKRITEGQVAEIQRLKPTPISEEERRKLNLWQKRARIIDELGTIPKRGYNAHHKYAYALEADMVAYLGPLMAKYMLVVDVDVVSQQQIVAEFKTPDGPVVQTAIETGVPAIERIELYQTQSGSRMWLTRMPLRITIVNADNPDEKTSILWVGEGADTGDKGIYKTYTGALKFFYMKWFMVATGDDPEAFERVDELAEGAGVRRVDVQRADAGQEQPEKGGRQRETSAAQIRQIGAMARALKLGGDDQTGRVRAAADYVDGVLETSVREALGDLEGDEAEKAFKQALMRLPGDDTGKVLYRMGEDARKAVAEQVENEVAAASNPYGGAEPEDEESLNNPDSEEGLPDLPDTPVTETERDQAEAENVNDADK